MNAQDATLRVLLKRAFGEDLDRVSDAIRRIERDHDAPLAAILWAFFWIRQGELFLARRELEAIANSSKAASLWGGIAVVMLGELCIESGATRTGLRLIQRGERILGTPA